MQILLLTQYYPPEVGAPQERLSYLTSYLKRRGHKVTVVTGPPNYPLGKLYSGYQNPLSGLSKELDGAGNEVLRTWAYLTQGRSSFLRRLANFSSFAISAFRALPRIGAVDLVLVETPPTFLSFTASLFALVKKARKVVFFADPWISFAIELGFLKKGSFSAKLALWLERHSLSQSDLVVVPNPGIRDSCLEEHSLKADKVKLVMNGVDVNFYQPDPEMYARKRQQFGFERRFVVVYAGTHQHQAGLDELVRAAARLQKNAPDILFLLVGDGADKPRIAKLAKEAGVLGENFQMREPMPATQIRELLNACDVGVNPLGPATLTHKTLSVKLLTYMACGLPVIITDRKIQRGIVEDAGCGLVCSPENDEAWAEKILWLRDNAKQREEMGYNARRYVVEHLSRERLAYDMEMLLMNVVER